MESDHKGLPSFITQLNALITNMRLYAADHPQSKRYLTAACQDILNILQIRREVKLLLIGDDIVVDDQPIQSDSANLIKFQHILREHGVESIVFSRDLTKEEFQSFAENLSNTEGKTLHSSHSIKIGKVALKVGSKKPEEISENNENLSAIKALRDKRYDTIKELYFDAQHHKKFDIKGVDDIIQAFIKGFTDGLNPLGLLAPLKSADEYTFTHVINVCILTMGLAEALGFSGKHLYNIGVASMLHDVGKLFIPSKIIDKPDRLTEKERSIIETHSIQGARYILRLDNIPKIAVLGALEHHIKYDGSGYPNIKGGWKTNIVSQMITISDVFDALRSRRSYSDPKPMAMIFRILNDEKGTTFNPFLVDTFMKIIMKS